MIEGWQQGWHPAAKHSALHAQLAAQQTTSDIMPVVGWALAARRLNPRQFLPCQTVAAVDQQVDRTAPVLHRRDTWMSTGVDSRQDGVQTGREHATFPTRSRAKSKAIDDSSIRRFTQQAAAGDRAMPAEVGGENRVVFLDGAGAP